jgi:hypothetical protein
MKSICLSKAVTFALEAVRETLRRCDILLREVEIDGAWAQVDISPNEAEEEDVATRHFKILVLLINDITVETECSIERIQREKKPPEWAIGDVNIFLEWRPDADEVYFSDASKYTMPDNMRIHIAEVGVSRSEEGQIRLKMY